MGTSHYRGLKVLIYTSDSGDLILLCASQVNVTHIPMMNVDGDLSKQCLLFRYGMSHPNTSCNHTNKWLN